MLMTLTPDDQRRMNAALLESLSVALDSDREWAHLSNVISNVISMHGSSQKNEAFVHCRALWHGESQWNGRWCPQPGCPNPLTSFGDQGEWEAWRRERADDADRTTDWGTLTAADFGEAEDPDLPMHQFEARGPGHSSFRCKHCLLGREAHE
jgi:hypothetical protein